MWNSYFFIASLQDIESSYDFDLLSFATINPYLPAYDIAYLIYGKFLCVFDSYSSTLDEVVSTFIGSMFIFRSRTLSRFILLPLARVEINGISSNHENLIFVRTLEPISFSFLKDI